MLGISIFLLLIAAAGKAVCDAIKSSWSATIFFTEYNLHRWVDPNVSWKNKYKNGNPAAGPRFFGSTTFLVWITDFWHLVQLVWLNSFILGITLYIMYNPWPLEWWWQVIILAVFFKSFFELFYRIITRKL